MPTNDEVYAKLESKTASGELLWHYTDWKGLEGLLEKKVLWATHYSCLNDTREILHGLELIKGHLIGDASFISNQIDALGKSLTGLDVYLVSFSKSFDSLEQWRAYSGSASVGFAVGFDRKHLGHIAASKEFTLTTCEYDDARVKELAEQIIEFWQQSNKRLAESEASIDAQPLQRDGVAKSHAWDQRTALVELIREVARFKEECFEYEQEVRLISPAVLYPNNDIPRDLKKSFRLKDSLLVPYFELPMKLSDQEKEIHKIFAPSPIRAVMVGPMTYRENNARAVADMTQSLNIQVAVSKRPLRTR